MPEIEESKIPQLRQTADGTEIGPIALPHIDAPQPILPSRQPQHFGGVAALLRKPPALELDHDDQIVGSATQRLLIDHVEPLNRPEASDLAYLVVELLIRREPEAISSEDEKALNGIQTLGHIARMFEHLAVLQSNPEG